MEKTITYLGVQSVQYVFSEYEILGALKEKYQIKHSYDYEFNLYETYEDSPAHAELIIKYATAKEKA